MRFTNFFFAFTQLLTYQKLKLELSLIFAVILEILLPVNADAYNLQVFLVFFL